MSKSDFVKAVTSSNVYESEADKVILLVAFKDKAAALKEAHMQTSLAVTERRLAKQKKLSSEKDECSCVIAQCTITWDTSHTSVLSLGLTTTLTNRIRQDHQIAGVNDSQLYSTCKN